MAAARSGSMVRGWQNGKYKVSLPIDLSVTTPLALASQNTRRGGDGGWARVRGMQKFKKKTMDLLEISCLKKKNTTRFLCFLFVGVDIWPFFSMVPFYDSKFSRNWIRSCDSLRGGR